MDIGPHPERKGAGKGRGNFIWNGGQLADLEIDRRQGPCDRLHQCFPHYAVQHPHPRLGRKAAGGAGYSALYAAAGAQQQRGVRLYHHPGGKYPDCRNCRRPAGGAVWSVLLPKGTGKEYLWDRLLFADEHRRYPLHEPERAADHHCHRTGWKGAVCAGGQCLCGRCGHSVAAR